MFAYLLTNWSLILMLLSLFIVIYGLPQSPAYPGITTILYASTITHTTYGPSLSHKSNAIHTLKNFQAYISTHHNTQIAFIQCDNGKEFDNTFLHTFVLTHDTHFRFSYPHTSQQDGNAEHVIPMINNIIHTLPLQASMPACFWVKALLTTTHILN
jgi:hypothetical protein